VARALDPAAGPTIILGADTEVVLDGRLLGKPRDAVDAARMLRDLRGREHEVITGLAIVETGPSGGEPRQETVSVTTRVRMGRYVDADIDAYVATGEPLDKAGAYAIQGAGGAFVLRVEGSVSNVVGLPLAETADLLRRAGLPLPWERR
jgi:septum formation protein